MGRGYVGSGSGRSSRPRVSLQLSQNQKVDEKVNAFDKTTQCAPVWGVLVHPRQGTGSPHCTRLSRGWPSASGTKGGAGPGGCGVRKRAPAFQQEPGLGYQLTGSTGFPLNNDNVHGRGTTRGSQTSAKVPEGPWSPGRSESQAWRALWGRSPWATVAGPRGPSGTTSCSTF